MNIATLFLQLLPLLVFIVADAVFNNPKLSIILAVVTAAVQMAIYYRQTGQIDWFLLLDVALIVALGAVSIILDNDLFFKLKPGLIDVIGIVLFLVFVFSPDQFLIGYFGRVLQGQRMTFNPQMVPLMKSMLVWMCAYLALHTGAVVYTALYSSRKVWAFVAGPGLYLMFIPIMIFIIVKRFQNRRSGSSAKTGRSSAHTLPKQMPSIK